MNAKETQRFWIGVAAVMFFLLVVVPSFWAYAQVSTCGWKGLFVECRIQECAK